MGGAGGWGGNTTPYPSQEGTHHSSKCIREAEHCRGLGGSLPLPVGCCWPWLLLSTARFPFLPFFLISSQPSFHTSFYPFFHALFPCSPFPLSFLLAFLAFLPPYEISQGEATFPKGKGQSGPNLVMTMDFFIK